MYLASPYSHKDPFVREMRYLVTTQALADALKLGVAVYSPIVHCHELAKIADLPRDAAFWRNYNFTMLGCAEQLWVLMLEGWDKSVGVGEEVDEAKRLSIPVIYIQPSESETWPKP